MIVYLLAADDQQTQASKTWRFSHRCAVVVVVVIAGSRAAAGSVHYYDPVDLISVTEASWSIRETYRTIPTKRLLRRSPADSHEHIGD